MRWVLFAAVLAAGCPLEPFAIPISCRDVTCDDANPCTDDSCDPTRGECVFTRIPEGTVCDADGDGCNGIDRCDASGTCVVGSPLPIDDDDDCTTDTCDPLTAVVTHLPIADCPARPPPPPPPPPPPDPGLWQPLATDGAPSARSLHGAVWTGSKMIVWGGLAEGGVTGDGALYDPASDSWTPLQAAGAPAPRHSHATVWTGSEMIVWGGYGVAGYEANGARYHPATDQWTALPPTTLAGRTRHAAVWTGGELIIWGGLGIGTPLNTGARYSPGSNSWATTEVGAPNGRFHSAAVWTGSAMLIWGGTNTFDWLHDGKAYRPELGSWVTMSATGAPKNRELPSFAWTGSQMLVWGGWAGGPYWNDGAEYNPSIGVGGSWTAMADTGAPSSRAQNVFVWTGNELCVWGGCGGEEACSEIRDDGGCYQPGARVWRPIPMDDQFLGRTDATAVWTGTALVVFGGQRGALFTSGGALLSLTKL